MPFFFFVFFPIPPKPFFVLLLRTKGMRDSVPARLRSSGRNDSKNNNNNNNNTRVRSQKPLLHDVQKASEQREERGTPRKTPY